MKRCDCSEVVRQEGGVCALPVLRLHQARMAVPPLRGSALESTALERWRAGVTRSGWTSRARTLDFYPREMNLVTTSNACGRHLMCAHSDSQTAIMKLCVLCEIRPLERNQTSMLRPAFIVAQCVRRKNLCRSHSILLRCFRLWRWLVLRTTLLPDGVPHMFQAIHHTSFTLGNTLFARMPFVGIVFVGVVDPL